MEQNNAVLENMQSIVNKTVPYKKISKVNSDIENLTEKK